MKLPPLVVIGVSLGAMDALQVLLGALPANFPAALAIVMHRNKKESGDLIPWLSRLCVLPVKFPLDREIIKPGIVYIAPSDYHLLVEGDHFAFTQDEEVNYARPSIDVFFESVADARGANVTGIVLTGMGHDGALGLAAIRSRGGAVLVQSPSEAAAPNMPLAALKAVPDALQLTLDELGPWLVKNALTTIRKTHD